MTRVALDVRALEQPELAERGIGRYTRCLLDALEAGGYDVAGLRSLRRPLAPARAAELFEHALLGRDARRAGADVLHSPSIDMVTLRPRVPYVVTVHDLVPLKQPDRYLRTGVKHRVRYAAVERAARLIVPTRAVAADCESLLGVPRERIAVVAEAAAPIFRPLHDADRLLARFNLPDEFLLWVGGLDPPDPRKGIRDLAAAAVRRNGLPLVLAGRVSAQAAELRAPDRVILVGRATDEELAALYSRAVALVLPSEEEGFGLPPFEALACGCPVAGFAIDAMRELHGGNPDVMLVEPGDTRRLLDAAEALAGRRATPPARTWADVAAATWEVYEAARAAGGS